MLCSLTETSDALGRAVSALRSENVQIITSGMSVHNLRDMYVGMMSGGALSYVKTFEEALLPAATAPEAEGRQEKMAALLKRSDARKAHPMFDHLLPIFVAAGAAGNDTGKRIWTMPEGSMAWAQYRFGELPPNSST